MSTDENNEFFGAEDLDFSADDIKINGESEKDNATIEVKEEPIDPVVPEPEGGDDSSKEEPKEEPVPEPEGEKKEDTPPDPEPDPTPEPTMDFSKFSEDSGFSVESESDVLNLLSELKELRAKDPLEGLSEAVKGAIELEKKGGDLAQYFQLLGTDFSQMAPKERLWHKFKQDRQEYAGKPDHARRVFEKEFKLKYSLQEPSFEDDAEREAWLAENKDEIQFLKDEMEIASEKALADLNEFKKTHTTLKQAEPEMSAEEAQRIVDEHRRSVDAKLDAFTGVSFDLGKNSDGEDVSFTLAPSKSVDQIKEWANNPTALSQTLGFNEDGSINIDTLVENLTVLSHYKNGTLAKVIKDFTLENYNRQTIEAEKDNPSKPASAGASKPDNRSDLEKVADQIDQARKSGNFKF